MKNVTVRIQNSDVQIACEPAEEDRVKELAFLVNKRIDKFASHNKVPNDKFLYVVTMLMMEDNISELKAEIVRLKEEHKGNVELAAAREKAANELLVAESLNKIAEYVETLANKIEKV